MRKIQLILIFTALLLGAHFLIVRPLYMGWGAGDGEIRQPLAGDPYIENPAVVSTRAVTIHAPAAVVWRWLVQLGQGRGGFYSYTWLENLFAAHMQNATDIQPELQQIAPGDTISFQQNGPFTRVALVAPDSLLVLAGGWTFLLRPLDTHTTRLIIRYPYTLHNRAEKFYYYAIFEPAHFVMEAGMMLGLKDRSEHTSAALAGSGNFISDDEAKEKVPR